MYIKHCFGKDEIGKESDKKPDDLLGFLLTNGLGGYFSLPFEIASRYHGWFFAFNKKMFKVIENIELIDAGKIFEIKNNFWNIERSYSEITEKFFLPNNYNSLVYELNKKAEIELFLDAKESYDNFEFGRFYEIFEQDNIIIVKCQNNQALFYLAIKTDNLNYSKIGDWILRKYEHDKNRNSYPYERYVYRSLRIDAQKIVFSVNFDKDKAIKEVKEVFEKSDELEKREKKRIDNLFLVEKKKILKNKTEVSFAYLCAKNSLNSLICKDPDCYLDFARQISIQSTGCSLPQRAKSACVLASPAPPLAGHHAGEAPKATLDTICLTIRKGECKKCNIGLYAGLPWFFQFWSRDELISFKPLDKKIQKKILLRQFKDIEKISNLDSLGWLFYRTGEMMNDNDKEIKKLFFENIDKFEILDANLTWMDTLSRPEGIELYALKLQMYKTAYQYSGDLKFLEKEKKLLEHVRKNFFNGKILADLPNNFIIRPNIFLAAYIYPKLLSKKEWIVCFENSLPKLWLEWGGMATVDKTSNLFVSQSSGEDPKSYHNGDSWFWLNNLTALVLSRLDKKRFKKYIEKILEASTKEILWKGVVGHHTELSSADKFKSEGCWAQSWSNALYIELVMEFKNGRG